MKKTLVIVFLFLFVKEQKAQQWVWDTLATPSGSKFEKDAYNHIYSFNVSDSSVYKLSQSGKLLWKINLSKGFSIKALTCSADSTVYVLGTFSGSLNISGHIAISNGGTDFCVAKLSPNGSLLWLTSGGSKGTETATDICMHGSDFLIIGTAFDTLNFPSAIYPKDTLKEIFIARFFSTGQLDTCKIARRIFLSQYDNYDSREIQVDNAGNIYALIYVWGTFVIDTDTITEQVSNSLLKFNSAMKYQSYISLANYYSHYVLDLRFNSMDELYYIRYDWGSHGPPHCYISKLSNITSTPVVEHQGYISLPGIDLDSCDNVYFVAGGYNYYGYTQPPPVLKYWNYVGMLSPSGNLNWIKTDTSLNSIGPSDIVSIGLNKCYVGVRFANTIQLLTPYQTNLPYSVAHAILQTTFGIPTNVTPPPHLACAGKTMSLTCSTGGAVHWFNTVSGNNPIFIGNTFTVTPPATGTYTYYAEARTCTNVTGRLPVTFSVFSNPTISLSSATICAGDTHTMNPSPSLTYSFSSGSATVTPGANKTYTVYGTDPFGCQDTATCNITVKPLPSIFIQPSQNPVCKNTSVTLTITGAQSYSINQTAIQLPYIFSSATSTNIFVVASDNNGCSNMTSYLQQVTDCTPLPELNRSPAILFFPNPTRGELIIQNAEVRSIRVVNSVGQTVLTKDINPDENTLDLSGLMDGIYVLESNTGEKTTIQKIILRK